MQEFLTLLEGSPPDISAHDPAANSTLSGMPFASTPLLLGADDLSVGSAARQHLDELLAACDEDDIFRS